MADKSLMKDVLVSDVLMSLEHSCHTLQVMFGK